MLSILGGLPNGAGNPATNKLIMRYTAPAARGVTIGVKQSGVQLGFLLAGGLLPPLSVAVGWRAAVAVAAVIPLTGLLVSSRLPRDRPPRVGGVTDKRGALPDEVRWLMRIRV